jgi:hypothetical protein
MAFTSPSIVGAGNWHKLLQNKGQEVVYIVDSYLSRSTHHELRGFEGVTYDRAWRNLSIVFLREMEKKISVVYDLGKKMKSGGQGGKVFMQVYLHHKYPEDLWQSDPSIILETILNKLKLHNQDSRTQISKQIETAVIHVHNWHTKSRISSAFNLTSSKQSCINFAFRDGTPIQRNIMSSSISSTSLAQGPEQNETPIVQINNNALAACSIQSEMSSVQELLLLLCAREGSNFTISPFVSMQQVGISSFANVLVIHNQISTPLPMLAEKIHEMNREQSQVASLIADAAEFINVAMIPDEPTMVRSCFLCTFMA